MRHAARRSGSISSSTAGCSADCGASTPRRPGRQPCAAAGPDRERRNAGRPAGDLAGTLRRDRCHGSSPTRSTSRRAPPCSRSAGRRLLCGKRGDRPGRLPGARRTSSSRSCSSPGDRLLRLLVGGERQDVRHGRARRAGGAGRRHGRRPAERGAAHAGVPAQLPAARPAASPASWCSAAPRAARSHRRHRGRLRVGCPGRAAPDPRAQGRARRQPRPGSRRRPGWPAGAARPSRLTTGAGGARAAPAATSRTRQYGRGPPPAARHLAGRWPRSSSAERSGCSAPAPPCARPVLRFRGRVLQHVQFLDKAIRAAPDSAQRVPLSGAPAPPDARPR